MMTLQRESKIQNKILKTDFVVTIMLQDILEKIIQACICIFHNLSVREDCTDILREFEITKTLQPYLKSPEDNISLTSMAILANIATEKDYDIIKANAALVAKLMYMLHKGMEDESRVYEGWPCKRSGRGISDATICLDSTLLYAFII